MQRIFFASFDILEELCQIRLIFGKTETTRNYYYMLEIKNQCSIGTQWCLVFMGRHVGIMGMHGPESQTSVTLTPMWVTGCTQIHHTFQYGGELDDPDIVIKIRLPWL